MLGKPDWAGEANGESTERARAKSKGGIENYRRLVRSSTFKLDLVRDLLAGWGIGLIRRSAV